MCVFSVAYRCFPDCPIFVLTNRDESTERPTIAPHLFVSPPPRGTHWFGGTDQQAGGTWFGVNEHGLLAGVTNRKTKTVPANPRSRGLFCRDILEEASAQAALDRARTELASNEYAGFNLILLTAPEAFVLEHADDSRIHHLTPGVHTIGNGRLDDPHDARVQRTQVLVEEMLARYGNWADCVGPSQAICRVHADENGPGICLHGDGFGTVGSSVVGLPLDVHQSVYHYAPGPPCRTPYVDYSNSLRDLLAPRLAG
jgi:uncharacterized protein with NRDE domain